MPSVVQFLEDLSASGIVEGDLLTRTRATLSSDAAIEDVAEVLVKRGVLTEYQAAQAMRGKASRLVIGKYLLLEPIGQGGMGRVFKAYHRQMRRVVAMKIVVSPTGSDSLKRIQRFEREAIATARLDHPHIVSLYDVGQSGRLLYLVMQYVEGLQLRQLVKKEGPLRVERALDIMRQAAEGLRYAHSLGAIHRDVKPSNIMLTGSGVLKILDLGLARLTEETSSDLTRVGATLGTVEWMAPEQAADARTVDHRADIYSLGCTFHYLLTGRPVYRSDSPVATLRMHREEAIPSLRDVRLDVPEALDQLFQAMVAKSPEQRPQSMDEVLKAIAEAATQLKFAPPTAFESAVQATVVHSNDSHAYSIQTDSFDLSSNDSKGSIATGNGARIPKKRTHSTSNQAFGLGVVGAVIAALLVWVLIVLFIGS